VVLFPNCKINLGLNIIGKRPDGYHNLETVFFPVNIQDALEVIKSDNTKDEVDISLSGVSIKGNHEDNLCFKAFALLKKDFPQLPAIMVHLHKTIPTGSGLGGGSANGASMLKLLNQKFALGLSTEQLLNYALQLGSDCPFFIINKPCFATGRGEVLEEINPDLSKYKLVIVNPGIHINTSWAFAQIQPAASTRPIKEIVLRSVEQWKDELKNDFEESVLQHYPELKDLKNTLYQSGALYTSMSGSGSSFYGIFKIESMVETKRFPSNYLVRIIG